MVLLNVEVVFVRLLNQKYSFIQQNTDVGMVFLYKKNQFGLFLCLFYMYYADIQKFEQKTQE